MFTLLATSVKRMCAAWKAAEASPWWNACDDSAACSACAMVLRIRAVLAPNADSAATNWGMCASRRLMGFPFSLPVMGCGGCVAEVCSVVAAPFRALVGRRLPGARHHRHRRAFADLVGGQRGQPGRTGRGFGRGPGEPEPSCAAFGRGRRRVGPAGVRCAAVHVHELVAEVLHLLALPAPGARLLTGHR